MTAVHRWMTNMGKRQSPKTDNPDMTVTKYEQWEPLVICRNQIKNLKRNPRVISEAAKRKLKKIIEKDGLLGPVNYNPKTGNVFGGNQRLALLDALEGRDDYFLTVAAAKKLSPERERKAAIYLNSNEVGGDWDLPALAEWLGHDKDLDPEDYGFSQVSLEVILGEEGKGLFTEQSAEADEALDDLDEMSAARDEVKEKNAAVERRQKMRKKGKEDHAAGDTERVVYVYFKSRKEREDWMEAHGRKRNERYISAADV